MRSFDFNRIWKEFVEVYGEIEGERNYREWLGVMQLDESREYGRARESYLWKKEDLQFIREDAENKYYEVEVGFPWKSMNGNVYKQRDLVAAALTLKGKHPSLNHKDEFWFSPKNPLNRWGNIAIIDGKFHEGICKALIQVPKTAVCPICNGAPMTELIDQKKIVNVSLEGDCKGGRCSTGECEGFYFLDPPFTFLTTDVLPGIPMTRIKPLESYMPDSRSIKGQGTEQKMKRTLKQLNEELGITEYSIREPFADYKDFADCTSKNSNKDDPEAYCATIKRQAESVGEATKPHIRDKTKLPTRRVRLNAYNFSYATGLNTPQPSKVTVTSTDNKVAWIGDVTPEGTEIELPIGDYTFHAETPDNRTTSYSRQITSAGAPEPQWMQFNFLGNDAPQTKQVEPTVWTTEPKPEPEEEPKKTGGNSTNTFTSTQWITGHPETKHTTTWNESQSSLTGEKRMKVKAIVKEDDFQKTKQPETTVNTKSVVDAGFRGQWGTPVTADAMLGKQNDLARTVVGTPAFADNTTLQSSPEYVRNISHEAKEEAEPQRSGTTAFKGNDTSQPKPEDIRVGPATSEPPARSIYRQPEGAPSSLPSETPPQTIISTSPVDGGVRIGTSPVNELLEETVNRIKAETREAIAHDETEKLRESVKKVEAIWADRHVKLLEEYRKQQAINVNQEQILKEQRETIGKEQLRSEDLRVEMRDVKNQFADATSISNKQAHLIEDLKVENVDLNKKYHGALQVNLELSQKETKANEDYLELAKQNDLLKENLTRTRNEAKKILKFRA